MYLRGENVLRYIQLKTFVKLNEISKINKNFFKEIDETQVSIFLY
jgi:hypothetical protein